MKTALIIVDVQKFFLHNAPDELPSRIVSHIEATQYDMVAFTVFKNTEDSNFVRSLRWDKCDTDEDTALPEVFKQYVTSKNVFTRHTYSGFKGTRLNDYLHDASIEKVVLCGVDTDACVLATAFEAFDNGYSIGVETDITYSDGDLEEEAQAIMSRSLLARD